MGADAFGGYFSSVVSDYAGGKATEHTFRPALKRLVEEIAPGVRATNEPKRVECGAPDYIVTRPERYGSLTIGYMEAKDIGKLTPDIEKGDQMRRYLKALPNLVLTDYLEFRWYTEGMQRQRARLASVGANRTLVRERDGEGEVLKLLQNFLNHAVQQVSKPEDLALRMARLTHIIRDIIVEAFEKDVASPLLRGWRETLAKVLIADLNQPEKAAEFADMFAQTLAYGLFSARIMDKTPDDFSRQEAQYLIPPTNPFLRDFFYEISGPRLNDEPFVGFVDDLAALLAHTDMESVLADFGKRTRQEDPVVHFYETFLAAYDPKLREARGVYYTPEPVVSYLVRSVDRLLKERFGCPDGLADARKVTVANRDPGLKVKGTNEMRKTVESHRVLVLDPACGTGTFLYSVVDHIRAEFMARNDAGMWSGYVKEHLLPRLFGFELLMAPYAVAHFKLGLQLAGRDLPEEERGEWAYDFGSEERLGVYLTNTLEGAHEYTGLPLLTQFVADETNAANRVKRDLPIMVVMGNPPYSGHSANKGEWISALVRDYYKVDGQPLGERNPKWLQDDYVKFIRFGQWR
ncbi:MAG: DNA methyltransferase, partial [Thermaceae bacterium]|nr:DNA methyltransferase [Thermaceae bacterium]